jgi:hypothetical protein
MVKAKPSTYHSLPSLYSRPKVRDVVADRVQIKCVNKVDRPNPHERITHVGGTNPDGGRWKMTQEAAVKGIEDGKWDFWVSVNGKSVKVIVAVSRWGNKYLKTEADDTKTDNLLSLPECPPG